MHRDPASTSSHHTGSSVSARPLRDHDWGATPLGPAAGWSPVLCGTVDLLLAHDLPMLLLWGPQRIQICNDRYLSVAGGEPTSPQGRPAPLPGPGMWPTDAAVYDRVEAGETLTADDALCPVMRDGVMEDAWFSLTCAPVREEGVVAGILLTLVETTRRVRAEHADAGAQQDVDERRAFLRTLGDALRPLDDPVEIQAAASRVLGRHLGVDRALYAEIQRDAAEDYYLVERDYTTPGTPSIAGRLPFSQWHALTAEFTEERTVTVDRAETDARIPAISRQTYAAADVAAFIGVPLVKRGTLVAVLSLQQRVPRRWTSLDRALAEDTAERTWAALQQARAEAIGARLARSEERGAFLLALSDALLSLVEPAEIQDTALAMLGQQLGVGRAYYFQADLGEDGWAHVIDSEGWRAPDARSMLGRRSHAALGAAVTEGLSDGRPVSFADVEALPLSPDERATLRDLDIVAAIIAPVVKAGTYRGGIALIEPHRRAWTEEEVALATDVAARIWDAVERARAEAALRASEERLLSAIEVGRLGLWDWNVDTGDVHWSDEHFRMIGEGIGDIVPSYERWMERIHPDDRKEAEAALLAARRGGYEYVHQFRVVQPGTGVRWITARGRFFYAPSGEAVRMVGAMVDVTEEHQWEARLQVLVAELQHRVRNILTVVRSVFARTVEAGGDVEDVADHFKGRLDSLARTQAIVTQTTSGLVDLETLIRDELLSVGVGEGPALFIDGPEVALTGKAAELIGLAVHELTTNALKYGALLVANGSVEICWHVNLDCFGHRQLHLNWTEQGVPAVAVKPSRKGFGSELIVEALPYRLGAETKLEFRGGGVFCAISMPLPDEGASAADPWKEY